ncbi:MAG: hypothetical protein OXI46_00805 [Gemmatimonadota bacterium]|nr:hypothetical protein [Gemmatimonadota bacterium]
MRVGAGPCIGDVGVQRLAEAARTHVVRNEVRSGKYVRFADPRFWAQHGLTRLGPATGYLPWAGA